MQTRRSAQCADAGNRVAGQLRQRLPAQAGAAGAEQHDVAGAFRDPAGGVADAGEVVPAFRQAQQRQTAVGMTRAQGFERGAGAAERIVQRLVGNAVRPDVFFKRTVDGLDDGHGQSHSVVMPALVAGIYAFGSSAYLSVDGRDEPGHDRSRIVDAIWP